MNAACVAFISDTRCTTLRLTATLSNALQYTAALCKTLQQNTKGHQSSPLPPCNTLQDTATNCKTLQHTATNPRHFKTLQHTARYCNTLQHTAPHCATLQDTATHYTTLQDAATHCNTLQQNTKGRHSSPLARCQKFGACTLSVCVCV